ncbi:MAG: hypothetical protein IPJ76_17005 [Flavobacteriales bacterium]|nr:MAG: hypothetical protein IPJ76_17005 [Flavobacteriales bacterium]
MIDTPTFTSQLDELLVALRQVCQRHYTAPDPRQHQLPTDPSIFLEDVLYYVMDQWSEELAAQGHVLELDTAWQNPTTPFPRYHLRMAGGKVLSLLFSGEYPMSLSLTISKGLRRAEQFSDARLVQVNLRMSLDPNILMQGVLEGLKQFRQLP